MRRGARPETNACPVYCVLCPGPKYRWTMARTAVGTWSRMTSPSHGACLFASCMQRLYHFSWRAGANRCPLRKERVEALPSRCLLHVPPTWKAVARYACTCPSCLRLLPMSLPPRVVDQLRSDWKLPALKIFRRAIGNWQLISAIITCWKHSILRLDMLSNGLF